jgi:serralysin
VTTLTAISAQAFTSTLGINTHIDFDAYGYQNLATVESSLEYLGVSNVRDSAESTADLTSWLQVSQATGVKFDDYIPEGSPANMQASLALIPQLAQEGVLNFIEGGNEEDDSYAASMGNTLAITAQFQQQVYAMGQQLGLPVINMSFGSGWTAANNWQGDYGAVGDLSAYATYGNAHTYPTLGQTPGSAIQQINALAQLADSTEPVITTEIGWDSSEFSETSIAQYVVDAAFDGIKDGDTKMYYYSLFNDGSGDYGLMNSDGTPTAAGTALHDLTTLLADTGSTASSFTPGSLSVSLSGNVSTDNTLLIQKSDGSDWLALWNESASTHSVTITLAANAQQILVFDPVTGTSSIASETNTNTVTVSLGLDPLLIEIIPASTVTISGGTLGTTAATATESATAAASPDPVVVVPTTQTVVADSSTAISGVSITDAWAAATPGNLAVTVSADSGTISMVNSTGLAVAGSGTGTISLTGSLAQINAELATLSYTGSAGHDVVDVDVWDQAGMEGNKAFDVTITAATTTSSTSTAPSSTPAAASSPDPVVNLPSSVTVTAASSAAIAGVSITDAWAAGTPGSLSATVSANSGTITMLNANGQAVAGSGTGTITLTGSLAQINAELATLSYEGSAGSAAIGVDVWDQAGVEAYQSFDVTVKPAIPTISPDPVVNLPGTQTVATGSKTPISGVSITDAWAGQNPGTLAVTVSATDGTIAMTSGGKALSGSGTGSIFITGSLAQINAELSTLTYTAGSAAGTGSVDLDVWDQAGVEANQSFGVQVEPKVTIAAGTATVTEKASNSFITATSGAHTITISGSGDTVSATGGAETIQASAGLNTITTGTANDTIRFAGSGNVIDAGSGTNMIYDSGTDNTIVLPAAGQDDIYGNTLTNGDVFDLRSLLAQTSWNGTESTLSNFLSVGMNGTNGQLTVDPTGIAGGASHIAAVFEASGQMGLSTLLAHAIT